MSSIYSGGLGFHLEQNNNGNGNRRQRTAAISNHSSRNSDPDALNALPPIINNPSFQPQHQQAVMAKTSNPTAVPISFSSSSGSAAARPNRRRLVTTSPIPITEPVIPSSTLHNSNYVATTIQPSAIPVKPIEPTIIIEEKTVMPSVSVLQQVEKLQADLKRETKARKDLEVKYRNIMNDLISLRKELQVFVETVVKDKDEMKKSIQQLASDVAANAVSTAATATMLEGLAEDSSDELILSSASDRDDEEQDETPFQEDATTAMSSSDDIEQSMIKE
jgi:hypothetical protein